MDHELIHESETNELARHRTPEEQAAFLAARRATRDKLLAMTLGFSVLTFGTMVLYHFNRVPLWVLIVVNVLFYIRAYNRMHDLCHAFSTRPWFVRFLPTFLYGNPVWGGVTAFITTHVQHHQYLGSNQDPWLPYYDGHPLRALFFNFIEPEHNLYNYLRQRGFTREITASLALDVARIATFLYFFGGAYGAYMIIGRVNHCLGVFLFNFWPHRERWTADATIGSFCRERELRPYFGILRALWGRTLVEAGMFHSSHHVLGHMLEPSHRYAAVPDDGRYTVYNDEWPLRAVQVLPQGPRAWAAR
jgi:fatty acid desaturase